MPLFGFPLIRRAACRCWQWVLIAALSLILGGCDSLFFGAHIVAGQMNPVPRIAFNNDLKKAEAGSAAAALKMGDWYSEGCRHYCFFGRGAQWLPDCNPAKAIEWYERAANAGVAEASMKLGALYQAGVLNVSMPPDMPRAVEWYRRAAAAGHKDAAYSLATIYDNGVNGIAIDRAEAAKWYMKQSPLNKSGNVDMRLAELYAAGDGVPQDTAEARRLALKAAEKSKIVFAERIASVYAQAPPADYAEVYYWALLAEAQYKSWRHDNLRREYLEKIHTLMNDYVPHLSPRERDEAQARAARELERICEHGTHLFCRKE